MRVASVAKETILLHYNYHKGSFNIFSCNEVGIPKYFKQLRHIYLSV